MDKKKLAQAVKRMEYCYKKGMLGARNMYQDDDGKLCVIGCLFDKEALAELRPLYNIATIGGLYRQYERLVEVLGDNQAELSAAQTINDIYSPLAAIKYLKRVIKNAN